MHFLERAKRRSGWMMCSVPGARLPSLSAHTKDWGSITVVIVKMLELSVLVSQTSRSVFALLHTSDQNALLIPQVVLKVLFPFFGHFLDKKNHILFS